ncbi:MAG: hypothetical protein HKO48_01625 [Nitrosopumilus sp.]|nr:hypothetical protein [Nitrosopumilus sp.]NNL37981.1 hypothetical protein [Nitrosopumilus sp.]NNM35802.1 hypothetical protein [Nitrosopumilus sp.]
MSRDLKKELKETEQEVRIELKLKGTEIPEEDVSKELKETQQEVMMDLTIKTNDFLKKFREQKGKNVFGI